MKKILFLSPYPIGCAPSQRLKYEQYYTSIEKSGYKIETSSFIDEDFWKIIYKKGSFAKKILFTLKGYIRRIFDLFRLKEYDIIYIHLWVTPFGFPIFEYLVRKLSSKVIYDIDDMVFLGHSSSANRLFQELKGTKKMLYLMKNSNHVITCTPKLDEFVRKYNRKTTDISSTINTENYTIKNEYSNTKTIVIGWSGSHSTSKYLYLLEDVFKSLSKKYNIKIKVIGDASFQITGLTIDAQDWDELTEVEELQKIDIGVYPLPNEEWVLGKSGLKALQYMALGLPTVATAIGANYRVIENGISGFLVNSKEEWYITLEKLIVDANLRKKIGTKARINVVENYSIQSTSSTYLKIIDSLS
ncbi:glycosyltransferase [Flammeovirga pectinis]|uniref:Glycosyltransferase n=1 Tax=Flammeovirga pectinis TaxID=2494373 RepID=A0A3S9P138_9BACT|nr:glycosyltransferase family 4 protein [Flammeovirga pectinis]AZQ61923.1 glycosyltransferase [Flammeovirga pectinis]